MNRMPTVDVIVVAWNHARFVDALFDGLACMDYPREAVNVYIVDNASTDGMADAIRARMDRDEDMPNVFFLPQEKNLGFAGGNNVVMEHTQAEYVYLLNPDAAFEPSTLRKAVEIAESHSNAASVQSLLVLAQDPSTINSIGNDIHFAGHGYCRGYLQPRSFASADAASIAYASGAGALYRVSALRHVGLFDETLFAYHEDLELGWRFLIAGYDNLLAVQSVLQHHYEFSRSISKWYLMERNRGIVVLTMYRWGTLLLLLPGLLAIELATWLFAIKGGWASQKAKAIGWFFFPSSWGYLLRKRKEIARLRKRSDRDILKHFVSGIEHQETNSGFMSRVANPLMKVYFGIVKALVRW